MASGPRYRVAMRRRREKRTDFRTRLALLKGGKPRLVIRSSNKDMHVQLIEFDMKGDKVLAEASALELKKQGWTGPTGNAQAAYLTGYLLGKKVGAKEAVVDLGLQNPYGLRLRAAMKGALDSGMNLNIGGELPSDERIKTEDVTKVISAMKV